jgi:hypothetical protein
MPASKKLALIPLLYRTTFFVLFVITTGLLFIVPGDLLYHCVRPAGSIPASARRTRIPVIIAFCGLTAFVAAFIYALRIWDGRRRLKAIGNRQRHEPVLVRNERLRAAGIVARCKPGAVEHEGTAPDGTRFETVVLELPNLLEASLLASAPRDIHNALIRQPWQGLREYLALLVAMGALLASPGVVGGFLGCYERARFGRNLSDGAEFEKLTKGAGEVLDSLRKEWDGESVERVLIVAAEMDGADSLVSESLRSGSESLRSSQSYRSDLS